MPNKHGAGRKGGALRWIIYCPRKGSALGRRRGLIPRAVRFHFLPPRPRHAGQSSASAASASTHLKLQAFSPCAKQTTVQPTVRGLAPVVFEVRQERLAVRYPYLSIE
jgi:hypothetical protein